MNDMGHYLGKIGIVSVSVLLAGAGLFVGGCAGAPTSNVRQQPDLAQSVGRLEKIAILPPEVGQLRLTATGEYELIPDREKVIFRDLTNRLKSELEARSYTILVAPENGPGDEVRPENPEIRQLRIAAAAALHELYGERQSVPNDVTNDLHANVGLAALSVAKQRKADALLIVRYNGQEKSGGRIAAEVIGMALISGLAGGNGGGSVSRSQGEIQLALIDGHSGDVLWANRLSGSTDRKRGAAASRGYYSPEDMAAKAIAPFPARVVTSRPQKVPVVSR